MIKWLRNCGLLCLLLSVCILTAQAAAQPPAGQQPKEKQTGTAGKGDPDTSFVRQAAVGGMAEVELGRLATQNAASADVKQFGQRMVDDHSKANEELKSLASKNNWTLPTEVDQKHRAAEQKLSKLNGAAFDKAYMAEMVKGHQEMANLFQREAKSGKDPDLKSWVQKTLPTVQEHLKMARDVNAKLGKAQ